MTMSRRAAIGLAAAARAAAARVGNRFVMASLGVG